MLEFFNFGMHRDIYILYFLIILPLFCVGEVGSKDEIFKGLNFGIFQESKCG